MSLSRPMAPVRVRHMFISTVSSLLVQVFVIPFYASPYVFLFHRLAHSHPLFSLSTSTSLTFWASEGLDTTRKSLPVLRPSLYRFPFLSPLVIVSKLYKAFSTMEYK